MRELRGGTALARAGRRCERLGRRASQCGFCDQGGARILETGIDPARLKLELTESALTDPNGVCHRNVKALRELGVRIALDDFGTGFSSLSRLQNLEVDRIKIDRSFVNGFGRENGDEAIVGMARACGLKTTAEGVETKEQCAKLKEIGCDEFQGFPVPSRRRTWMRSLQGISR